MGYAHLSDHFGIDARGGDGIVSGSSVPLAPLRQVVPLQLPASDDFIGLLLFVLHKIEHAFKIY